jgi:hypothetical protein
MIDNGFNRFTFVRKNRQFFIISILTILFMSICVMFNSTGGIFASDTGNKPFKMAFSMKMFSEVNIEDARAAMKAWILTVAQDRNIPVDPEPQIYNNFEEILRASSENATDGFAITTEEFWMLNKNVNFDRLILGVHDGKIMEEYIILVHQDSNIKSIKDLHGRSLSVLENPRMSLALIWFDTVLLQSGLTPSNLFCSQITHIKKISQVVLPVFFRNRDACLVSSIGFQTMSELNPQVGKQLRVLASSPQVVPNGFIFRPDYVSPYRDQMLIEMRRLSESPAGRQILTLTHSDRIDEYPFSSLDSAFDLLSTHKRLSTAATGQNIQGSESGLTLKKWDKNKKK